MDADLMLLLEAKAAMATRKPTRDLQWRYYTGDHDRPYAPPGASDEYMELRDMSQLPLTRLAVRTPCQRLRVKQLSFQDDAVGAAHRKIRKRNRMNANQRLQYVQAMVYGVGIGSVWPNATDSQIPVMRAEDANLVYLEPGLDPLVPKWAAKTWTEHEVVGSGVFRTKVQREVGVVYYPDRVVRFVQAAGGAWVSREMGNPMGQVPLVPFYADVDAQGGGASLVDSLIPMQRAIDTLRFDLLLAAQFAAYRQRVATGYDPTVRDVEGNPLWITNPDGSIQIDEYGQPIPIVRGPGAVGVDRLLTFPGTETRIFDLDESNLDNYVRGLEMLISSYASVAQVPPQYLIGDFKNVSGDLMVSTEATLRSLLRDLQTSFGESTERQHELAGLATGNPEMVDLEAECEWEDTGPVSLAQVAQFAAQMVPLGYPMDAVVAMMPGMNEEKASRVALQDASAPATGAGSAGGEPPQDS